MKLNKKGWSLKEMLLLSGVILMFLFIAIFYIMKLYGREIGNNDYYLELEKKLENQALVYVNDYFDGMLTNEEIMITRKVLRNYDLDIDLVDKKGDACSGYVLVSKSKGIINKKAYISCNKYTTNGYKEWME